MGLAKDFCYIALYKQDVSLFTSQGTRRNFLKIALYGKEPGIFLVSIYFLFSVVPHTTRLLLKTLRKFSVEITMIVYLLTLVMNFIRLTSDNIFKASVSELLSGLKKSFLNFCPGINRCVVISQMVLEVFCFDCYIHRANHPLYHRQTT